MTTHDYVVVGAGSAGCAVAARLSEDPGVSVLLLEAGPRDRAKEIRIPAAFSKLFQSKFDWAYETAPQEGLGGRSIYFPRGKTLGGSSAMNAMMFLPGYPEDFDAWPEGWSWDEVRPYMERLESGSCVVSELRAPNPMTRAFLEASAAAGVEDVALARVTQRSGLRCSAADVYLKPARKRPNLTVATDSQVLGLEFDGRRATGVRHEGGTAAATREVILSAGAIGSPQLLMVSGVGPADQLLSHGIDVVHDLPGVGQNLSDHCMAITMFDAEGSKDSLYAAEKPIQLLRLVLRRNGLLTSNVGEAAAFVRSRPELPAPDMELIFAPVLYMDQGLTPPPSHGFSIASVVLQPRSRGSVSLRSGDPREPPLISPGYLQDPEDVRVLVEGTKLARRVARQGALSGWLSGERAPGDDVRSDEEIESWVRSAAHTIYHPVGTCALGSVVDGDLRVQGLEALRVVDASVMPSLNRGHTHAPTTMVAERAAAKIRGTERRGAVGAAPR